MTDYEDGGARVATLMALLDRLGELPFDEDGMTDRVYRHAEAAFVREFTKHFEGLDEPQTT